MLSLELLQYFYLSWFGFTLTIARASRCAIRINKRYSFTQKTRRIHSRRVFILREIIQVTVGVDLIIHGLGPIMSCGRTMRSNSSGLSKPNATTACLRVMPSARAFWTTLAALS